jgi:hypothetical protein
MKKRSLIVSLALLLGLPFGLFATAGPAAAAQCYVDASDGGVEPAPNFQDPDSCRDVAHGYWM